MNAWKQKKTFVDIVKDICGYILYIAMCIGIMLMLVIF